MCGGYLLATLPFFQPIDILIAELIGVLGLSGAAYNRIAIVKALRQHTRIGFWPAMCYIAALLTIAARCAGQVVHYDTGFYGDTVVRWFTTYPLVPGLTNLHRQIGLNSNVFLCVALLNQAPLPNLGFHLLMGVLLCILFVHIVKSFLHLFFGQDQSILDYFIVLLVIPCIFWVLNGDLVGTNTDLPTSVVSIAGLISLLGALQDMHKTQMSANRIAPSGRLDAFRPRCYIQDLQPRPRCPWLGHSAFSAFVAGNSSTTKEDIHYRVYGAL